MKFIASGVTFSAAIVRSPSFSRSSSSTTTSMRPARKSSRASGIVDGMAGGLPSEPAGRQQALDVLGDYVDLEVDEAARPGVPQVRHLESIGDERDREGSAH